MTQAYHMTFDDKLATINKAIAIKNAGDKEAHDRLMKTIPLPPYLAKMAKEKIGLDFLLGLGWNLSEVEEEFGQSWLNK